MNKTAIKNFAILARNQLIMSVKQSAYEYGITETNMLSSDDNEFFLDSFETSWDFKKHPLV